MDIKLHSADKFRVKTGQDSNFIDIRGCDQEGAIAVDAYPYFHYIEIRRKDRQLRTFYFESKRHKKYMDLGWWSDAEVVLALNEKAKT